MSSKLDASSADHTSSESLLASILVARFLRSNNYHDTLETFIREAALPSDAGVVNLNKSDETNGVDKWTLESIIGEKKKFDQTLSFERYGDSRAKKEEWSLPGKLYRCIQMLYNQSGL
jgi:hypothetical protein